MKTVLIVDSAQERNISFDFGLDKRLYLRVAVHTVKAARVAINSVQFDMAILGELPDVEDFSSFLKELQQAIPQVQVSPRTIQATAQVLSSAYVESAFTTSSDGTEARSVLDQSLYPN